MTHLEDFLELYAFEDERILWLQLLVLGDFADDLLELDVPLGTDAHAREQVLNQTQEDRLVFCGDLGHVEVSEGSHQDGILCDIRVGPLEPTRLSQHGLDGPQTPVVVHRLGQQLLGQPVQGHELVSQRPGGEETLRHEHVLADERHIRHHHRTRPEESLQVLGQLGSSCVSRVHGDEEASCGDQANVVIHELKALLALLYSIQYRLDLCGDDREHFNRDAVELVEASPCTRLRQAHEDLRHGEVVHLVGAVEDEHRQPDGARQILGGLGLARSGRAGGSATHDQVEGLCEGDVAAVGQGRDDQTATVAHVLVHVGGRPVTNLDDTRTLLLTTFLLPVEPELGLPCKGGALSEPGLHELLNHIASMHINGDQRDDLHAQSLCEVGLDSSNELLNSVITHTLVVLHGVFRAPLEFFEGPLCLLCPQQLTGNQGDLRAVVLEPNLPRFVDLPILCSVLGNLEVVTQSPPHVGLKIGQISLDGSLGHKRFKERHVFLLLRIEPLGYLALGVLVELEVKGRDAVETIAEELRNFDGVVSIGEDFQQCLVGHEVEPREGLLLLLQVIVERLLAELDVLVQFLEEVFPPLSAARLHDVGALRGLVHHLLPLVVQLLKALRVLRQLRTDILRLHEDGLQTLPVLLDFHPNGEDIVNCPQVGLPFIDDRSAELDELPLGDHAHEVH
mmetsp:Transcript_12963/g.30944  ORF Transcript_12963/g.30944 Transcript_12963/m.30944 type:complete len:678 (-) Transcript_12963:353-2386(-)